MFALGDALVRDGLVGRFVAQGISQDRVVCIGSTERRDHLQTFENIDISLDPFPQNGGISTWESLYMGVPVVARLGNGTASRISGALLAAIDLNDWVADDDDGYVAIAQKFASMPSELEKLRADLPARIANSPAGNVAGLHRARRGGLPAILARLLCDGPRRGSELEHDPERSAAVFRKDRAQSKP